MRCATATTVQQQHYTTDHFATCLCLQNGVTALHLAASVGQVAVVRLLIEAQAKVNIQTEVFKYFVIPGVDSHFLLDKRKESLHLGSCMAHITYKGT